MTETITINTTVTKFEHELCNGYAIAPKIAESIADLGKELFVSNEKIDTFVSGQIKYEAISHDQPVGVARTNCKTKTVILTIISKSDIDLSSKEKRRNIIERITREAYEQGGLLTQQDLAAILNTDERTIRRSVKELTDKEIVTPLRGTIKNIGRGQTHKHIIIELALQKYTFIEISRKTHHSPSAIDRYLSKFCKVIRCYLMKMPLERICYLVENSEEVVRQYLQLYEENKDKYKEQMDIFLGKYTDLDLSDELKKKDRVMNKWLKK